MKKGLIFLFLLAAVVFSAAPRAHAADADRQTTELSGTLTGILTAKGENWIEVKAQDAKESLRYRAPWIGGMPSDGGGFDKRVLSQIKRLIVPNLVHLRWGTEEGRRVYAVEMIKVKDAEGAGEGIVTAKGENWIEIRSRDLTERYMPQWFGGLPKNGGGLDKGMLRAIANTPVGTRVRFEWIYSERKRIVVLRPIE